MAFKDHSSELSLLLKKVLDREGSISNIKGLGGGSINEAYSFEFGGVPYFIKENSKTKFPLMFQRESQGLKELQKCKLLVIPEVVLEAEIGDSQYLILEYLQRVSDTGLFYEQLGSFLAALHRVSSDTFGFGSDNYIGSLPQKNDKTKGWQEFFYLMRLEPLVKECYDEKLFGKPVLNSFEKLHELLSSIFPNEKPSLIHGDLWSGNKMNTTKGPSVFDPAVYYGHREMDLAMSRLFGGFEPAFYRSYNTEFPLEKGHEQRADICNLYPLLVHVRLFGTGYLQDVLSIIKRF
jgi:protein-ribulosamine 3-kinase